MGLGLGSVVWLALNSVRISFTVRVIVRVIQEAILSCCVMQL